MQDIRQFEPHLFISIVFAQNLDREPVWRYVIDTVEDVVEESGRFYDYDECAQSAIQRCRGLIVKTPKGKTAIILIPVYQRPEVTLFCMDAMVQTCVDAEVYGWKLHPVYVTDEKWAIEACVDRGADWVVATNEKGIGWKINGALSFYGRSYRYGWDWLITLGSDDIMRPEIFASANLMDAHGFKFFGTNDCILYDWNTGAVKRHKSGSQIIGAGRFVHRSLVEQCDYKLWPDEAMSGLDGRSEQRIEEVTGHYIQHMPAPEPYVVDIKSDVNIHSYEDIPGSQVSRQRLLKWFPVLESISHRGDVNL